MNDFEARGKEQQNVIESESDTLVVLGGAGTGKTVCALAAARRHLERKSTIRSDRVLFLSFSRAAVARIVERSRGVLGSERERVDIMTFHALAFSVVRRFGSVIGNSNPTLVSPARQLIRVAPGSIGYDDLIPAALRIIRSSPAVASHLQARWGLVIVDEFQDTGDDQEQLIDALAHRRRLLLGDADQCIYTFLANKGVRYQRIHDASEAAGPGNTIVLPEESHRDPSQVIPAIARAIQRRDFQAPALRDAIASGRLALRPPSSLQNEVNAVAKVVRDLRAEGLDVAVFTHHNDMLARLSDGLEADGIEHEISGLSDALAAALEAQATMLRFAARSAPWADVREHLAVFVTSAQRGKKVPRLASDILNGTGTSTLRAALVDLELELDGSSVEAALATISNAHQGLALPTKSYAWSDAWTILATMHARSVRNLGSDAPPQMIAQMIAAETREVAYASLTDSANHTRPVQLMNLYQTKGREADATVIVLREGDWLGDEGEPWLTTSRLLYVVFSRARKRIVVVPIGNKLHPAVDPLRTIGG